MTYPQPATTDFLAESPTAYPLFYRTYSRRTPTGDRESWNEVAYRTVVKGLREIGRLTHDETELLLSTVGRGLAFPSGRWLWVGGTKWLEAPENYPGAFNCTNQPVNGRPEDPWEAIASTMDLAMMGSGTGVVLEPQYVEKLPAIARQIDVLIVDSTFSRPKEDRAQLSTWTHDRGNIYTLTVGDSRAGWVGAYKLLLDASTAPGLPDRVDLRVDLTHVRKKGERLEGFGGVANPIKLADMFKNVATLLNGAVGRQLTPLEVCLLIDQAAVCIVAGNLRRCLPEDALVHTEHGLVPIKDIKIGDYVQTPLGFRRVLDKFDQGTQDVYELETNSVFPRATLNHRVAVLSSALGDKEWKTVGSLESGDRLMHNTSILPGRQTSLPLDFTQKRPAQSTTAKAINIPSLTADVAWLIGYTHGNGYVAVGRNKHNKPFGAVTWAMNSAQPELLKKLRGKIDQALAAFGVTATHRVAKKENTSTSICSSIRLAEYFYRYIKQPKTPLEIPSFILQGSSEIRSAYLAGLADSDGAIHNRPPHLVTTVYPKFARQVLVVLASLGIAGRLSVTRPQKDTWQLRHSVTIPAFKNEYNALIATHSCKGILTIGQKVHGFTIPREMMRAAFAHTEIRGMGFNSAVDSNFERYRAESGVCIDIPVSFKGLGAVDHVQTYDIEVEEAHCFYCDGYLTHNSAGMRQFSWDSPLHKTNLWQQDDAGNWRIDPARDALRMANHTRVYHTRPSRAECIEAVREQFYSGEGAIQFAPESIARASADILDTDPLREQFIEVYTSQGREAARQFLLDSGAEDADVDHRLERYGLNPCVTGDTWVLTDEGPRQVRSLIGKQHGTFVNGEIFSTTRAGFFSKGKKPIVRIETAEGYALKLTPDHKVQKLVAATQRRSYGHWVAVSDLEPGDRIFIHNHREATHWTGWGTREEGWEFGRKIAADRVLVKRYGGPPLAVSASNERRATFKNIPQDVEQSSYEFHQGFLQSLFDEWCTLKAPIRHGTALQIQHPYGQVLEQIQRMLLRLGIVCSVTEPQINPRGLRTPATLTISRDNLIQFKEVIGFSDPDKQNELELLLGNYQRHPDRERFTAKIQSIKPAGSEEVFDCQVPGPACFDANGFVTHNCGEIIGNTFACNLAEVHLNRIDPLDLSTQEDAFRAAALSVSALLQRGFTDPRFQWSRELDPIVAVCFTGGFDFFVTALGTDWLRWWQAGRPGRWGVEVFWEPLLETPHRHPGQLMRQSSFFRTRELEYLEFWRGIVEDTVEDYCHRHGLKKPNRATAIQPSGSKSLLTGASPGWHPPKAQRFIRRMTFGKNDPVALACLDFGYSVVPSQSDKDEDGRLLDDPFDPRCTEWLVEIPVEVPWANLPGASDIDISGFSALAQFDFYMQIQRHYVRHNTSATIELREDEIEPLGDRIYQAIQEDEGYISAALLARFDAKETFPRLPFEPIDKATYERLQSEVLQRRKSDDFHALLARYDKGAPERDSSESGPAGCDSDKCLLPQAEPGQK